MMLSHADQIHPQSNSIIEKEKPGKLGESLVLETPQLKVELPPLKQEQRASAESEVIEMPLVEDGPDNIEDEGQYGG